MDQLQFLSPGVTIALRAALAILAATVGGLMGIAGQRVSHKLLCGLVSLAAGALLGVTALHIVPETVAILGITKAALSLVAGFLVFALVGKYVYFVCPACAASASEHDTGYLRLGVLLMISMSIHSTVDGLAISAGSAHAAESIGLLILLAVSYHKVPEGLALVSVARLAGYRRAKALFVTVLIEFTTALGALVGLFFLAGVHELVIGLTLGFVAGSFLYTVGFALLREMFVHEKGSIFAYVGLGFLSMLALGSLLSHVGIHAH